MADCDGGRDGRDNPTLFSLMGGESSRSIKEADV